MRIVIPYVQGGLDPGTRSWGELHGAEFHDLTGDHEAYFGLLARLWRDGRAFMVVEQDVIPPDNAIESMVVACSQPWCFHPYHYVEKWRANSIPLGCTRFSQALLLQLPDVVDAGLVKWQFDSCWSAQGSRGWRLLSQRLRAELESHGIAAHEHWPYATHAHSREEYLRDVKVEVEWRMQRLARDGAAADRGQLFGQAVAELWGPPPYNAQDLFNLSVDVLMRGPGIRGRQTSRREFGPARRAPRGVSQARPRHIW